MHSIKFFAVMWLALAMGLLAGASCKSNSESDVDVDSDSDSDSDSDGDGDSDTRDFDTDSEEPGYVPPVWDCPSAQWQEAYKCVSSEDECAQWGGRPSENYVCGDGADGVSGVCCDKTPEPIEGATLCPESTVGISCQTTWICYVAEGTVDAILFNDYYCDGDNVVCCQSLALDSSGGDAGDFVDGGL